MTVSQTKAIKNRYVADAVETVTPAQLVTMLYDKLVRDLAEAEQALAAGDVTVSHGRLVHAQEIVLELHSSLDTSRWEAAAGLADLYVFLVKELMAANVAKDRKRVAKCRQQVEPLRDAWHRAARQLAAAS